MTATSTTCWSCSKPYAASLEACPGCGASNQLPKARHFRVEADWHGGGFGYTIPAASAEDAYLWGERRAGFHRDAEITVKPAYPADAEALVQGQGYLGAL